MLFWFPVSPPTDEIIWLPNDSEMIHAYSRMARHGFLHKFDFVLFFLMCPELFNSGGVQTMESATTARLAWLVPDPKALWREQVLAG